MTINTTASLTTSTGPRAADFRMHALDLNPNLVAHSDDEHHADALALQQLPDLSHWLISEPTYQSVIRDLVHSVREMQRLSSIADARTDDVLAADLVKEMGLWDHQQPRGQWSNARFMATFLVAYARLYLNVRAQEGSQIRQHKQNDYASSH